MVERVSKTTVLSKVKTKTADLVSSSIISSMKPIADKVLTITADNGSEFAYGLVRQYLRKGCDFNPVTDNVLEFIMDRLNNRPRKALGFATPNEIFYKNVTYNV